MHFNFKCRFLLAPITILILHSCNNKDESPEPIQNSAPVFEDQVFNVDKDIRDDEIIGILVAADHEEDELTFNMFQNDHGLFHLTTDGRLSLSDGNFLDFEVAESHNIVVWVTDGVYTVTATITINVTDVEPKPFITLWQAKHISLPLYPSTCPTETKYNFIVDWGDGTVGEVTSYDDPDRKHVYEDNGNHMVSITGTLIGFNFWQSPSSSNHFIDVLQWGDVRLGDDPGIFAGCTNLVDFTAEEGIPLEHKRNLDEMFAHAYSFNGDINNWDVSSISSMSRMFWGATSFNQNLSSWDVSNVKDMSQMFSHAKSFDSDISAWDVSSVTNMRGMFENADVFNQDISRWDVGKVTDMNRMFYWASLFNSDLSAWDVSNVTNMQSMFEHVHFFNQDISRWDVSSVADMSGMFHSASLFNQDLNEWDVSNVTVMDQMFYYAANFDGDIGDWDVGKVTDMRSMFDNARFFNQDISRWNVSGVTDMSGMFERTVLFNQDIGNWDVSGATDMGRMFYWASSFNQDIGSWNVGEVKSMGSMFTNAFSFKQDLSQWNTSKVTYCAYFSDGSQLEGNDLPVFDHCQ